MADDVKFKISGDAGDFTAAMQEAKAKATEALAQIQEKVVGVGEAFESLQRTAAAFAAAVVGGELLEKLGQLAERAENMKELSEQFGVSTTTLQGLQTIAAQTGISTERLAKAATGLQAEMAKAGEGGGEAAARFEALGITMEQLRDPSFSIVDAMTRLGVESNSSAALVGVLGPRMAALIPVMRELALNHHAVADAAARSNALTGQEIEELEQFHAVIEQNNVAWQNFETRIAVGVVPALQAAVTELTNFATSSESASEFGEMLAAGIAKVAAGVVELVKGLKDTLVVLFAVWNTGAETFGGLADAQNNLLHGNFRAALEDLKHIPLEIKSTWGAVVSTIEDNANQAAASINKINLAASGLNEVHPSATKEGAKNPLPDFSKPQSDEFAEMASKLEAETRRSEEERVAIITRSAAEQLDVRRESALGAIAVQEQEVQEQLQLGQISAAQYLQQERQLINERLQVQRQYFTTKAALQASDQVASARADTEMVKAQSTAFQQMQVAQTHFAQNVRQTWQSMSNQISSAFSGAIKGMLQGTETFGQAVKNIWNSLLGAFVDMLVKMLAQYVSNQLIQLALDKTTSQSKIAGSAAEAGAAGTASFAGAPWPVDLGAPAFGASMALAAGSYSVGASAAGGYDIGYESPIVATHPREMILPQSIADPVRDMAARGPSTIHLHGKSSDVLTLDQLAGMLKSLGHRFKFV